MIDPRHQQRINTIQNLYAYSFSDLKNNWPFPADTLTRRIVAVLPEIDACIKQYALRFPIEKIARSDLAILRLAVWELRFGKIAPPKAVVNEAIELAKEFGGDQSFRFVNGVLGKVIKI